MAESQIERIIRGLKCTEAEAIEIAKADKEIDRGAKMSFDLSADAEKAAKKYAKTGTRSTTGAKIERKHKDNPTKEGIIQLLATFLQENGNFSAVNITNASRMIAFSCENDDFELTLVQKRAKK